MKTLIIDNFDSFTYNLAHLVATVNGEDPLVVTNDQDGALERLDYDNIIVSPGPGRPDRERDFGISRQAILHATKPVLGVCLGHQGISSLHGGSIIHAPEPMHGRTSLIHHAGSDLFEGIPSPFTAVRYHSLMAAKPLPADLEETAWTEDGLVMALRSRSRPLWGVQFHPESILTENGARLLENFRNLTPRRSRAIRTRSPETLPSPSPLSAGPRRVRWREVGFVDPPVVFSEIFAASPDAFWLDSSLVKPGLSRWSFMGDAGGPLGAVITYRSAERTINRREASGVTTEQRSIFDYLHDSLSCEPVEAPFPFRGGHVGWLGYEMRNECGSPTDRRAATPDAYFIRPGRWIAIDHQERRMYVASLSAAESQAILAEKWIEEVCTKLASGQTSAPAQPRSARAKQAPKYSARDDRDVYLKKIHDALDHIRNGESYQICLTNRISVEAETVDPLSLYLELRSSNPAPHAAFIQWRGGSVISASPERFLALDRDGIVSAKPIKGTIRRSLDAEEDRVLAGFLQENEKDQAENLMIVDLLRNDLSRVCRPGSVTVPLLFDVESYATVHQLVSTVEGALAEGRTSLDLLKAAFPGGSMTGAPKLRAMELIDALEDAPRGIYSGALGWIGDDGALDLSIVIRTIVQTGNTLTVGAGGGIVALSQPIAEHDEVMLKAQAALSALAAVTS